MDNHSGRVFVICGDGECNEGSVWEALMFVSTHKLNNFVIIVDSNKFQGFGATNDVIEQRNIAQRIDDFGFDTFVVDGNNIDELKTVLTKKSDKPIAIIANTVKGKGVSYMEDKLEWHYKSPNDEQLQIAFQQKK
jgi:transketolase